MTKQDRAILKDIAKDFGQSEQDAFYLASLSEKLEKVETRLAREGVREIFNCSSLL